MAKKPKPQPSLLSFQKRFPDEAACARFLFERRWPEGFVCPRLAKGRVPTEDILYFGSREQPPTLSLRTTRAMVPAGRV